VVVDAGLDGQELRGDVERPGRDRRLAGRRRHEQAKVLGGVRCLADDFQVRGEHEHGEAVRYREGCGLGEVPCLGSAEGRRDRPAHVGQEPDLGIRERVRATRAPEVDPPPQPEPVPERHGREIPDAVLPQQIPPHQAALRFAARRVQQRVGRVERRPPVHRRAVPQPDQPGQLGQAAHVGQRRGAHRRDRVGKQPGVVLERDRVAQHPQQLDPQGPVVQVALGDAFHAAERGPGEHHPRIIPQRRPQNPGMGVAARRP
jgi:hypothetical protein